MPSSDSWLVSAVAMTLLASGSAPAATASPDSAQILRQLERLEVVGNVLYVAAHPDDENTRLLSWLVNDRKVHAAYLSLTRGEGGQNLLGPEQAPLLGLIRTQELLAARGLDGAEQLFGRERDFGYSKTSDETLSIWGHDPALSDVVWAIRRFHPDVIVTRFSPDDHDTHGHHTASAMLAVEAFAAAANLQAFPEQLAWVKPWQAKRIVWNKGVFGPAKPGSLDGFTPLDVGGFDPLLGSSAGEIAARSRSMHKSQGFGVAPQRGPAMEYFRLLAGDPMKDGFLDGVDQTWARIPGSQKLAGLLAQAHAKFRPEDPAAILPTLLEASAALDALPDFPWKAQKQIDLHEAIAACAGLFADATSPNFTAVPGGSAKLTLTAIDRSAAPLTLKSIRVGGEDLTIDKPLVRNQPLVTEHTVTLPKETPVSNPYWLAEDPTPGRWTVSDQRLVGLPEQPSVLDAELVFASGTQTFSLHRSVTYAWVDPVAGERHRPLSVLPAATLDASAPILMFPDRAAKELHVRVRSSAGAVAGTLKPTVPTGFTVDPVSRPFSLGQAGDELDLHFQVHPPAKLGADGAPIEGSLQLVATLADGTVIDRGVIHVDYPHIPIQTTLPRAAVKLVRFEMKRALTKIGYIPGAGDDVPAALRQVGYDVTVLSDEALASAPLQPYEAIVIGVRAFNTKPLLTKVHGRLMDYVNAGGTLVVQYNTQNRISSVVGPIGPFPFNISQDRVTDETAPATLLEPKHAVFQTPNRIGDHDFLGWVQERGLYFADSWDAHYTPLLSMHDPGEPERKGSLLVAHVGKGRFVYTGLAFFRQLPAGVPGAYRLFANLLAHDH